MAEIFAYDTVTEAVQGLKRRGFILDFNLSENFIVSQEHQLSSQDFEIVEVYRFEGDSDPADEAVVYAIRGKNGVKGILVNGYGISSEEMSEEMMKKLQIHRP
jgi:hypothetical protein